jgi:hypothetical protein
VAGLVAAGLLLLAGAGDNPPLYWSAIGTTAALAFLRAVYRVRLEVDDEEIRVFNVRKTYRIPWESVTRIDVVDWWLGPGAIIVGNAAVRVTTRFGKRIVIDASASEEPRVRELLARFRNRPEIFGQ